VDGGVGAIMAVDACVQVVASTSIVIQMWKAMLSMNASEVEWFFAPGGVILFAVSAKSLIHLE